MIRFALDRILETSKFNAPAIAVRRIRGPRGARAGRENRFAIL
jgi:hypothetical protein